MDGSAESTGQCVKARPDEGDIADDEPGDDENPNVTVTVGQISFCFSLTARGPAVSVSVPSDGGGQVIEVSDKLASLYRANQARLGPIAAARKEQGTVGKKRGVK